MAMLRCSYTIAVHTGGLCWMMCIAILTLMANASHASNAQVKHDNYKLQQNYKNINQHLIS